MLLIKNGRICGETENADILIDNGIITDISGDIRESAGMTVLDATGLTVAPGLMDMHVHLREPGYEYKEDVMSGAAAAAAGGVTTCCCMPNTSPVADNADVVRYIVEKAGHAPVRVLPYGAVTIGQKGKELTDFKALKAAGAVALSDDGNPIQNAELMRRALILARDCGLMIISHCEDADMVKNYAVNEGKVSRELGIPGRPAIAEDIMVARDAMLAAETGARVHIAHVSTAGSVEIIRRAKNAGVRISAETCPQYFTLTEDEILRLGALARVNPPLRTVDDVNAVIRGLADGAIDAIATDHAPHSAEEKARPLTEALSGMIGLETSLAITLTALYHKGHLGLDKIIELTAVNPARLLGLSDAKIAKDAIADIVIFDPDEKWVADPDRFVSKARNTPFAGMTLQGRVKYTISRGKVVYVG